MEIYFSYIKVSNCAY